MPAQYHPLAPFIAQLHQMGQDEEQKKLQAKRQAFADSLGLVRFNLDQQQFGFEQDKFRTLQSQRLTPEQQVEQVGKETFARKEAEAKAEKMYPQQLGNQPTKLTAEDREWQITSKPVEKWTPQEKSWMSSRGYDIKTGLKSVTGQKVYDTPSEDPNWWKIVREISSQNAKAVSQKLEDPKSLDQIFEEADSQYQSRFGSMKNMDFSPQATGVMDRFNPFSLTPLPAQESVEDILRKRKLIQ